MIQTEHISDLISIQQNLQNGRFSMTDLVQHYLTKIEGSKSTNSYIRVFGEESLDLARQIDLRLEQKEKLGKLLIRVT